MVDVNDDSVTTWMRERSIIHLHSPTHTSSLLSNSLDNSFSHNSMWVQARLVMNNQCLVVIWFVSLYFEKQMFNITSKNRWKRWICFKKKYVKHKSQQFKFSLKCSAHSGKRLTLIQAWSLGAQPTRVVGPLDHLTTWHLVSVLRLGHSDHSGTQFTRITQARDSLGPLRHPST